jgi:MerR family mercuric resistance operon transcriptional regulator
LIFQLAPVNAREPDCFVEFRFGRLRSSSWRSWSRPKRHARACSRYRHKRFFRGTIAEARSAEIQIGQLSRRTGCNIETIRYYERIALLPKPARRAGRYRVYETADVRRLIFIRRARELGFALDAVRALLKLSENDGQGARADVRELAESHLAEVRAKIADLQAMERILADAVRCCAAGETAGCPIIDALSAV